MGDGAGRDDRDGGEGTAFGNLLRRHRRAAGLSQEELAERAGLSARGISDLERGVRTTPRGDTLRMLADGLGLAGPERAAFLREGRRGAADRPSPSRPSPPPTGRFPGARLPAPLDAFVGREREVAALAALLADPAVRLVTLTGPGGSGKTRLAVVAAGAALGVFPDGVAFVPLATIADPALVAPAVARTLGVAGTGDRPAEEGLAAALGAGRVLLVLDNLEQVLAAAPLVPRLLAACPGLTVLATSRAPLRVSGERRFPVPPLGLPPKGGARPADLLATEAARLFADRAASVDPAFSPNESDAPAVAAIVRRLDGLPLAIELAAARVALLPPAEILARLDRALPLLAGGPADAPARQRTMRDAIAWSHDLLPPGERVLFRRLAAFAGGWTDEAAAAVAGGGASVLDGVAALVDAGLVQRAGGPGVPVRFGMLETVREYAQERLVEADEEGDARDCHADFFLGLAERAAPELIGPGQLAWLDRLAADAANLLAALDRLAERGRVAEALRLAAALGEFWDRRGHFGAVRRRLEAQLARSAELPPSARAPGLLVAARLAVAQFDLAAADRLFREALAAFQAAGDRRGEAWALVDASNVPFDRGDLARSDELVAAGSALVLPDDDPRLAGRAATYRGRIAFVRGDYAAAERHWEEALGRFRAAGDRTSEGEVLADFGWAPLLRGDLEGARRAFREAVALVTELGDPWMAATMAMGAGLFAAAAGDAAAGTGLMAAGDELMRVLGLELRPVLRPHRDRLLETAREALGEAAFAAAREAGAALTEEAALAEALASLDALGEEGNRAG